MGLSARDVQDRSFSTSMRGYDRTEVASYQAQVADHMGRLEERLAIADAKAARAQEELDRLHDVIDNRLAEARDARTKIIEEARQEAESIVARASQVAGPMEDPAAVRTGAAIIAEADAKAELRMKAITAVGEQARLEAAEIELGAKQAAELKLAEADRVIEAARRDARDIRRRAEADRSEMEAQLEHLRRVVASAEASKGADLGDATIELRDNGSIVVDLTAPASVPEDLPA